jgi:SAM-dependent methyltransferase
MQNEPGREIASRYDEIADWFDAGRSRSLIEIEYLSLAVKLAPKKGTMLDLGCGGAEPIARYFVDQGFRVTGIDTSPTMIGFCKQRFPDETWLVGDMRGLKLDSCFDVIVAWDSFFHLNHESQRSMFRTFRDHSEPGGVLVFTSGPKFGVTYGTMEGRDFYHASLDPEAYQDLLADHGYTVVLNRIEDPACGGRTVWVAIHSKPLARP